MPRTSVKESKLERRKVSQLTNWSQNPRAIDKTEFERLKQSITKRGIYKPILVNQDNIVLGGNMRLKAFQDLGIESVMCSIVETKTDKEMFDYAINDNERFGYYQDQELADLVSSIPELDLGDYRVDLGKTVDLEYLLQQFSPENVNNTNQEIDTDVLGKDLDLECPKCHFRFKKNVQL